MVVGRSFDPTVYCIPSEWNTELCIAASIPMLRRSSTSKAGAGASSRFCSFSVAIFGSALSTERLLVTYVRLPLSPC